MFILPYTSVLYNIVSFDKIQYGVLYMSYGTIKYNKVLLNMIAQYDIVSWYDIVSYDFVSYEILHHKWQYCIISCNIISLNMIWHVSYDTIQCCFIHTVSYDIVS